MNASLKQQKFLASLKQEVSYSFLYVFVSFRLSSFLCSHFRWLLGLEEAEEEESKRGEGLKVAEQRSQH